MRNTLIGKKTTTSPEYKINKNNFLEPLTDL